MSECLYGLHLCYLYVFTPTHTRTRTCTRTHAHTTRTVDEVLLGGGGDAAEVAAVLSAVLLGVSSQVCLWVKYLQRAHV